MRDIVVLVLLMIGGAWGCSSQPSTPPPGSPTPPAEQTQAARQARQKIEELGGFVHDPEEGHVDLTIWRGVSEDLALLLDLNLVTHLYLKGPETDDESMQDVISKLRDLRQLSLRESEVTDVGLAALTGHEMLAELSLISSPITDAALQHVGTIPNLRKLVLSDLEVTAVGLGRLRGSSRLEELNLSSLKLNHEDLQRVQGSLNIRTLLLSGPGLTDGVVSEMIRIAPKLEELFVAPGEPHELSAEAIKGIDRLEKLESLFLSGSWINNQTTSYLVGLETLKRLSLQDSALTNDGLAPLAHLHALETLNLRCWSHPQAVVTDDALEHIRGLKNLQRLNTYGLGISEQALQTLWKDMPDLESIFSGRWAKHGGPFYSPRE